MHAKSDQACSTTRRCISVPIDEQLERQRDSHVSTEKPMLHARLASKELKGKDDVRVTYSSCSHTASPAQKHALASFTLIVHNFGRGMTFRRLWVKRMSNTLLATVSPRGTDAAAVRSAAMVPNMYFYIPCTSSLQVMWPEMQ